MVFSRGPILVLMMTLYILSRYCSSCRLFLSGATPVCHRQSGFQFSLNWQNINDIPGALALDFYFLLSLVDRLSCLGFICKTMLWEMVLAFLLYCCCWYPVKVVFIQFSYCYLKKYKIFVLRWFFLNIYVMIEELLSEWLLKDATECYDKRNCYNFSSL